MANRLVDAHFMNAILAYSIDYTSLLSSLYLKHKFAREIGRKTTLQILYLCIKYYNLLLDLLLLSNIHKFIN